MELTKGIKKLGAIFREAREKEGKSREVFGAWLTAWMAEHHPELDIDVREGALSTIESGNYSIQINLAAILAIVESGVIPGLDYNKVFEIILTGEDVRGKEAEPVPDRERYPEAIDEVRRGVKKQVGKGLTDSELLSWLSVQAGIPKARLKAILDGQRPNVADVLALAKAIGVTSNKMLVLYGYEASTRTKKLSSAAPKLQRV